MSDIATKPNPMMRYSNLQLRASLANWAETERGKVTDSRGYGSDDRRAFKYRADILDAAVSRLVKLENALNEIIDYGPPHIGDIARRAFT